jgi:hypothetical protein
VVALAVIFALDQWSDHWLCAVAALLGEHMRAMALVAMMVVVWVVAIGCQRQNPALVVDAGDVDLAGGADVADSGDAAGDAGATDDMIPAPSPDLAPVPCGGLCAGWQMCTPSGCVVDPSSRWNVRSGYFYLSYDAPSGHPWDPDLSMPDPYAVCTRNGAELGRTNVVQDAQSGNWYVGNLCTDVSAAELMHGTVTVSVYDEDTIKPDDYAGTIEKFTEKDFSSTKPVTKMLYVSGTQQASMVQLQLVAR